MPVAVPWADAAAAERKAGLPELRDQRAAEGHAPAADVARSLEERRRLGRRDHDARNEAQMDALLRALEIDFGRNQLGPGIDDSRPRDCAAGGRAATAKAFERRLPAQHFVDSEAARRPEGAMRFERLLDGFCIRQDAGHYGFRQPAGHDDDRQHEHPGGEPATRIRRAVDRTVDRFPQNPAGRGRQ